MTSTWRRALIAGVLLVVLAALAFVHWGGAGGVAQIASYFNIDTRAKEGRKGAAKGPPPVPVTVAAAAQETVPISFRAIGNVEAYLTVATKARVDGQIVTVNFREGEEVRTGD